jgi:5-methylcytosine-specific restriction endonuclease McrA
MMRAKQDMAANSKICPICQKSFRVKPSHAHKRTYCSRVCMAVGYRDRLRGEGNPHFKDAGWRMCPTCGESFHSYRKDARYCSVACVRRSPENRARARALLAKFMERKRIERSRSQSALPLSDEILFQAEMPLRVASIAKCKCEACGRFFYSKTAGRKACSRDCGTKLSSEKNKDRVVLACTICGEPFEIPYSAFLYSQRSTCSLECSVQWRSQKQAGERSHLWQGGKTSQTLIVRGSKAYSEWRGKVFQRDNYTCQLCGNRGGKLSAHHIFLFSTHQELRFKVENGISLCWDCHKSIRGKEDQYHQQFAEKTGMHAWKEQQLARSLYVQGTGRKVRN